MAIFEFDKIYRSIKEEIGEEMAIKIFPEYSTLPKEMSASKQVNLSRKIMENMDVLLDKNVIEQIRHKRCCNIPQKHIIKIKELKEKCKDIDEVFSEYSKFLFPGYIDQNENVLTVSFGGG